MLVQTINLNKLSLKFQRFSAIQVVYRSTDLNKLSLKNQRFLIIHVLNPSTNLNKLIFFNKLVLSSEEKTHQECLS